MNLMRSASTLHASGCVIGDVNESNVYILSDGTVRFIDVDSFQVQHHGEIFPCNVGTPIYTPPELQGMTFRGVTRTSTHDMFGLSVLVFQLLVQGCHPFAGIPSDGRGRTIEDAIREGLYAYSPQRRDRISPPPNRLHPSTLGEVAGLFERSFLSSQRPTAAEWMNAIDRTRNRFRQCTKNPRHTYLQDCVGCPLCNLPRDPFPHYGQGHTRPIDLGGMSIGELIREAEQLPTLRSVMVRCGEPDVLSYERSVPLTPPNKQISASKDNSGLLLAGSVLLCIGVGLSCAQTPLGIGGIVLGGILFAIAALQRKAAANQLKLRQEWLVHRYDPFCREAQAAVDRLVSVEINAQALDRMASATLQPLSKATTEAREWLFAADKRLQVELGTADKTYQEQLVTNHLERQVIAHASIPDIGPSRKAMLASFGVETAADINPRAIQRIAGFGPHLTNRLLAWRQSCERKFTHHADLHAPPDWIQRIQNQHRQALVVTAGKLQGYIAEYRGLHTSYEQQLAAAAVELDNARRECRAALNRFKSF